MPLGLFGNRPFASSPLVPLESPLVLLQNSLARPSVPSHNIKMPGLVSATGVLAFLNDDEPELKVFALQTLNDDIDTVWTEVAAALIQMCVTDSFRNSCLS